MNTTFYSTFGILLKPNLPILLAEKMPWSNVLKCLSKDIDIDMVDLIGGWRWNFQVPKFSVWIQKFRNNLEFYYIKTYWHFCLKKMLSSSVLKSFLNEIGILVVELIGGWGRNFRNLNFFNYFGYEMKSFRNVWNFIKAKLSCTFDWKKCSKVVCSKTFQITQTSLWYNR